MHILILYFKGESLIRSTDVFIHCMSWVDNLLRVSRYMIISSLINKSLLLAFHFGKLDEIIIMMRK